MNWFRSLLDKLKTSQATSARQSMQEEWFNDYYLRRRDVYKMNFFRGIFFGFGSVIGGTVVLAIVIWVLALFVDFPLIGDLLKNLEHSLSQPR
jgi:hypothetical protein